jgi:hypothetical protein
MECSWNARAFPQMRHDGLCMKSVVRAKITQRRYELLDTICENTIYQYYQFVEFIFSIDHFECFEVKARYFDSGYRVHIPAPIQPNQEQKAKRHEKKEVLR